MVTDYELAWTRLQEFVAGKTQHGREGLLTRMAEIAAESRVPSGELSRLLRLYGVEVERARQLSAETSEGSGSLVSGFDSLVEAGTAGHHRTKGVHDGRSREAVSAG